MSDLSIGKPPAIAIINPTFINTILSAIQASSCFGIRQLWIDNYQQNNALNNIKHSSVDVQYSHGNFIEKFDCETVPIAVTLCSSSERLPDFVHPNKGLYIFGSENKDIPGFILNKCKKFITIPIASSINLEAAIYLILYDRLVKRSRQGLDTILPMSILLEQQKQAAR